MSRVILVVIAFLAVGWVPGMAACNKGPSRSAGESATSVAPSRSRPSLKEKIRHLDQGALRFIEKLDGPGLLAYRKKTGITICGIYPIALMLTVLKDSGLPIGVKVLDYYTSGDRTGDWTNTVSYYSIAFYSKNGKRRYQGSAGDSASGPVRAKGGQTDQGPVSRAASDGEDPERPMVTGPGWYPKNAAVLRRMLDGFVGKAKVPDLPGPLVALISPHAGYRFSGLAAAHGYKVLGREKGVERVVLLGVSHHVRFHGVSVGKYRAYATPFGPLALDESVGRMLRAKPGFGFLESAHAREHSLEMQMPLLKLVAPKVRIAAMLVGFLRPEELEKLARPMLALLDGKTVLVASSDFTHRGPRYGYEPFAGRGASPARGEVQP